MSYFGETESSQALSQTVKGYWENYLQSAKKPVAAPTVPTTGLTESDVRKAAWVGSAAYAAWVAASVASAYLAYKRNDGSVLRAAGAWFFSVPYLAWVGLDRVISGTPLVPGKSNPKRGKSGKRRKGSRRRMRDSRGRFLPKRSSRARKAGRSRNKNRNAKGQFVARSGTGGHFRPWAQPRDARGRLLNPASM